MLALIIIITLLLAPFYFTLIVSGNPILCIIGIVLLLAHTGTLASDIYGDL